MSRGLKGPRAGRNKGRVLVVAGSDPSGGAGIQADIKTITALGGYAATAITAITVQNTMGVADIMPIDPDVITAQIKAVLVDIGADAIKTGMLHDAAVIEALVGVLRAGEFDGLLVVDPVMVATSGGSLLAPDAVSKLKSDLLPLAKLVTPNIPEAEALSGLPIKTVEDMHRAGEAILAMGPEAVLLKGGHLPTDQLVDVLLTSDGEEMQIESTKLDTRHTHGTGCTLASAIATGLANGESLELAFSHAHAFVRAAIEKAPGFGNGCGPLGHAAVYNGRTS